MKIKECAYYEKGYSFTKPYGTCNLLPEYNCFSGVNCMTFRDCGLVAISECPYKLFNLGKIDKIELNKRIEVLTKCR